MINKTFSWKDWLIVIPARLQSTRLPEKPLADLGGKPLIVRVYERLAPLAAMGATIVVGTDHTKVSKVCNDARIPVRMTDSKHPSGTDRVQEVASHDNLPFILNVQGDEPFIDLNDLGRLCQKIAFEEYPEMATLMIRNQNLADFHNPNCVKVVNQDRYALYFSRAPIPFPRDTTCEAFWQHMGVYAYTKQSLQKFCQWQPGVLEKTEKLEQLRALENGMKILLVEAKTPTFGIDTPENLEEARARF